MNYVRDTNHQLSTTNHQPPTTNHQLPTTNHQPPTSLGFYFKKLHLFSITQINFILIVTAAVRSKRDILNQGGVYLMYLIFSINILFIILYICTYII
jgi:hypothetical protein